MKHVKARLLALCGLMVLVAAALAPIVAEADYGGCPTVNIPCPGGFRSCSGTLVNGECRYSADCLNCK